MPLPRIQRGELWTVDLGYLGKVRPVVVVGIPFLDHERTLYHNGDESCNSNKTFTA
jgi:hypothetical protein